ncbi:BID domain-containing T4SS effector [Bartonella heixiaziensis]|uniref:BID domain-containing T4SS effector n=1 Tax=Bartonella heixiaziensis TaxID=1461000 RepID=UPI003908ABA0
MKKNPPSSFVARMVEEFQKRHEQSIGTLAAPTVAKNNQKPPLPNHSKIIPAGVASPQTSHLNNKTQSNTATQDSQAQPATVAPQRPLQARDKELSNSTATQDSQAQTVRVAPQRPPRAKDKKLSNNTETQDSQAQTVRVAPQRPPRAKDKKLSNSTATQKRETTYAELEIKTPPSTSNKENSNVVTQKDKVIYATIAPLRISTAISTSELIQKIRNNILVQGCKDEIKNLSQTIYGNQDILQKKLETIEKNPILGESLSWQIEANPALVANLAGRKILGVKSRTRKKAEEHVSRLCLALENYADIVKQAKENIFHGYLAEQTPLRRSMDLTQMAEDLQKSRNPKPEQEMAPLPHKELVRRVKSNTLVQYCSAEIIYLSTVAYRNPSVLQSKLEEVQKDPALGENLALQVKTHPHLFGKLSGHNFHGFKSKARNQAENALIRLSDAIEGYAEAVKHAKENILESHQAQQKRHTQSTKLDKSVQSTEHQQKSLIPEKKITPLSEKEIANRVQKDYSVQRAQIEIRNWCKIVYNDPYILQPNTEEIQRNPVLGQELSQRVANNSTIFAPLAGKQMLGIKNNARKYAEASLPSLCTAIDHYTETVKQVREEIVQTHQAQQSHQRQSSELTQDLQKQQTISRTPKQHEHATIATHNETAETTRQEGQRPLAVPPRKVGVAKAMAFTS